jgi:hypothetical protein
MLHRAAEKSGASVRLQLWGFGRFGVRSVSIQEGVRKSFGAWISATYPTSITAKSSVSRGIRAAERVDKFLRYTARDETELRENKFHTGFARNLSSAANAADDR